MEALPIVSMSIISLFVVAPWLLIALAPLLILSAIFVMVVMVAGSRLKKPRLIGEVKKVNLNMPNDFNDSLRDQDRAA